MKCTLIIDKSGSMIIRDQKNGRSRWEACREATIALAYKCEEHDPDGMTLYLFSGRFKRFEKVTAARVHEIYDDNEPGGGTDLAEVLSDTFGFIQERRKDQGDNPEAELVLVVTDGEPDDHASVVDLIKDMSTKVASQMELAISFIQVGNDPSATEFLRALDDDLVAAGAAHDIVDTVTLEEMEEYSLTQILEKAFID
ncbi:MAG: VWA domain-containing protein [Thermonemataceae bacterium]